MLTKLTHDIATPLSRRRWLAATAGLVLGLAAFTSARAADDTIKVGVLHSLSGTMAISETTLKDTVLFMIDEQNKKGGVLGKKLENRKTKHAPIDRQILQAGKVVGAQREERSARPNSQSDSGSTGEHAEQCAL